VQHEFRNDNNRNKERNITTVKDECKAPKLCFQTEEAEKGTIKTTCNTVFSYIYLNASSRSTRLHNHHSKSLTEHGIAWNPWNVWNEVLTEHLEHSAQKGLREEVGGQEGTLENDTSKGLSIAKGACGTDIEDGKNLQSQRQRSCKLITF